MEEYYDNAVVTLGDGSISIDQGVYGVQKVSGSRNFVRDPRLSKLAASVMDRLPPIWKAPTQMAQVAPDSKWCFECGDVRPKHYFTAKKGTHDGLDPRCKSCEAARQRKGYQAKVGREIRAYNRRDQATA